MAVCESWYFHQKREGKMFEKSRIQFNARHEDNINRGRLLMTLLITRTRVRWRNIILEFILRHIRIEELNNMLLLFGSISNIDTFHPCVKASGKSVHERFY